MPELDEDGNEVPIKEAEWSLDKVGSSLGCTIVKIVCDYWQLSVGSKLDVRDTVGKWCRAEVRDVSRKDQVAEVFVHYSGWSVVSSLNAGCIHDLLLAASSGSIFGTSKPCRKSSPL